MNLLSIDPSSTRTGYAIMSGPDSLIEAGLITPQKQSDGPLDRIRDMALDAGRMIDQNKIDRVIVEVTTGKVARRLAAKTGGSGLGVYGMAVGAIWWECCRFTAGRCEGIAENVWTRRVPKRDRQSALADRFPQYASEIGTDRGGDISDAIGLALWWFKERSVQ